MINKTIKTWTKLFLLLLITLNISFFITANANAQTLKHKKIAQSTAQTDTVENRLTQTLDKINSESKLPGFSATGHDEASYEPGASNITSAIFFVIDLIKYRKGTVAVIMRIAIGVR